jgi:hypothetical protein
MLLRGNHIEIFSVPMQGPLALLIKVSLKREEKKTHKRKWMG